MYNQNSKSAGFIPTKDEKTYIEGCALQDYSRNTGNYRCRGLKCTYCILRHDNFYLNCPFKKAKSEGYKINAVGHIIKKEVDRDA